MGNARYTNVFEAYHNVKAFMKNSGESYTESAYQLMDKFYQYLNSFKWAKDDTDRVLWNKAGQGIKIPEMARITHKSETTLKGRVQKLNYAICSKLFDGNPFSISLIKENDDTLNKYIANIDFALSDYCFYTEIPDDLLNIINDNLKSGEFVEDFDLTDVYNVLRAYSMFSRKVMRSWVSILNPKAVDYVNEKLQDLQMNDEIRMFSYLRSKVEARPIDMNSIDKIQKNAGIELKITKGDE